MSAPQTPHPSENVLRAFALGKLDDAASDPVVLHLEDCADCRSRAGAMSSDSFLGRIQGAQAPPRPGGTQPDPRPAPRAKAAPAVDTLPPGLAENPDYEVVKELGRGGMGVVYLVHNKLMGRDEAVKIIGKHLIERPGVLERFLREIRSVARLRHENIVAAHSATRMGESLVYAMEYVDGQDLSRLVKVKGPLPVVHAAYFTHQTALGLQHAHEHGIVHRDIKPGNLMLTSQGKRRIVKVLDFGLTKVVSEQGVDTGLTAQNQMLGTPDYIAPEQIRDAQSADIRADIYSLGCTLYYLLTGHAPFQAASLYDLLQAHFSMDAHPLNLARPEVPAELACLVAKMMAKDPHRRFQTPGEVARALTPFFKPAAPGVPAASARVATAGAEAHGPSPAPPPTQPATAGPLPVPPPVKPATPPATGPRWDSLVEFKETERSANETLAGAPAKRPPRKTRLIALAAYLSGMIVLGIVITIKSRNGDETKIKVQPGASITIENDDEKADSPKPRRKIDEPSPATQVILTKLQTPIAMNFATETPLEDVLKYIKSATQGPHDTGIPIYVDPFGLQEAEKTMTTPITLDLEGVALKETLPLMLAQLGLAYLVKDGLLIITSEKSAQAGPTWSFEVRIATQPPSPKTRAVVGLLDKPLSMNFATETPLEDVLKYIKSATQGAHDTGIPIYVDPLGLQEAEKTMTSPITLHLEGVALKVTLPLMLRQLGLAYCLKGDMLIISSEVGIVKRFLKEAAEAEKVPGTVHEPRVKGGNGSGALGEGSPRSAPDAIPLPGRDQSKVADAEVRPSRRDATVLSGSWTIEGEDLVQSDARDHQQSLLLLGDPSWSNFDFKFKAMATGGTSGFAGVFHVGDLSDRYAFGVGGYNSNGIELCFIRQGKWGRHANMFRDAKIELNHWYDVLIVVRGAEYRCFLAGQEIFHHTDDRYKHGRVGFSVWESTARFRDIEVTTPGKEVLWKGLPVNVARKGVATGKALGTLHAEAPRARREEGSAAPGEGASRSAPDSLFRRGSDRPVVGNPPPQTAVVLSGAWRVEGKELVQSGIEGTILLGEAPSPNYDLRFRGQVVSGNEGFVALFHYKSGTDLQFFHVGELGGKRVDLGVVHEGKAGGQSKSIPTVKGRWYDIWIKVRGAEFWCHLDGRELFHDVDRRFTNGRVGLATWDASARFRDIVITTPEGESLWEGLPDLSNQAAGGFGGSPTSASRPGTAVAVDPLQPGTVWKGKKTYRHGLWSGVTVAYEIHVRERHGTRFVGDKFDNGVNRNGADVEGEFDGKTISWRERSRHDPSGLGHVKGIRKDNEIVLEFEGHVGDSRTFGGDGMLKLEKAR